MASYHTLASDLRNFVNSETGETTSDTKKRKKAAGKSIFELEFHRIVLDEAHIIRNSKSFLYKAAMAVNAKRKLCLTGTPFVNSPSDIQSLLSFLQVEPLCRWSVFERQVIQPIKDRREIGLQTIRTTMAYIALRRNKTAVENEIQLPPKVVQVVKVTFPAKSEHKETYDYLYNAARSYFVHLLVERGQRGAMLHYMEMLALVLRIRQLCCHRGLIHKDILKQIVDRIGPGDDENLANRNQLSEAEGKALLNALSDIFQGSQIVECAVCFNGMQEEDAVVLRECKHVFCQPCLNQITNCRCPMCRTEYTPDDMIQKQAAKEAIENVPFNVKDALQYGRSPKVCSKIACQFVATQFVCLSPILYLRSRRSLMQLIRWSPTRRGSFSLSGHLFWT